MSSILKAIRKIEDDKRTRDNQAPDLMVDHGEPSPRSKPVVLPSLVAGLLLGALAVAVVLILVPADDQKKSTMSQTVVKESSTPENAKGELVLAASVETGSSQNDQKENPRPMESAVTENVKVEAEHIRSKPVVAAESTVKASLKQDISLERLYKEKKVNAAPPLSEAPVSEPVLQNDADLKVSEIFYQEDESSRMAVVNDLPVMVGTHVDDAVVESIHEDRVVFTITGKSVSIPVTFQ